MQLETGGPTFAQLYLLIDQIEQGGLVYDRQGNRVPEAANALEKN